MHDYDDMFPLNDIACRRFVEFELSGTMDACEGLLEEVWSIFCYRALVEEALERRKLSSSALDEHVTHILKQPKTNHADPCHI